MARGAPTSGTSTRSPRGGPKSSASLNDVGGLRKLAAKEGIKAPSTERKPSALQRVAGVLSTGSAATSGFVSGALDPNRGALEVASERARNAASGRDIKGFSDVYREQFGAPESRAGKVAVGFGGWIADVLFDPLTYLTFGLGSGLKVGSQTLSKASLLSRATGLSRLLPETGTALLQRAGREAAPALGAKAAGEATRLVSQAAGKRGLTAEAAEQAAARGFSRDTIEEIARRGAERNPSLYGALAERLTGKAARRASSLVDAGGVKLAGKTLITAREVAESFLGRAAAKVAGTEIGKAAVGLGRAVSSGIGKAFSYGFGKNPKLLEIVEKGNRKVRQAVQGIVKANEALFKDLSDTQMVELFDGIFQKKLAVAEAGSKAGREAVAQLPTDTAKAVIARAEAAATSAARKSAKGAQQGERLTFADPKLQAVSDKLFEGPNAIVPRFAKAAGLSADEAIKFYIPSKFAEKLPSAAASFGKGISSPKLGFLKKFEGFQEGLIRDPFEAYSRGQAEVVTARIKTDAARAVARTFGKSAEDAKRLGGYVEWTRKGLGAGGKESVSAWVPKEIAKGIDELFEPGNEKNPLVAGFEWATGLLKGYLTSIFPAFHIRNLVSNEFQNMLKIGVDVGNMSLRKMAIDAARGIGLDRVIPTKTGKRLTLREVVKQVRKESDILDSGAFGGVEQMVDDVRLGRGGTDFRKPGGKIIPTVLREEGRLLGDAYRRGGVKGLAKTVASELNPLSVDNVAFRAGRAAGGFIEDQAKMVSVLSAVAEGKTVREGVKQAEEALFNYGKLTRFEREVMRNLIPFYTFARKNFEFQLKMLATNPGTVAAELKAFKGAGEAIGEPLTEEDLAGLPDYVLNSLGIKAGAYADNRYGQSSFITGFGLPIEEFLGRMSGENGVVTNVFKSLLAGANPILKFPAERATGVDFFQGKPIVEIANGQSLKAIIDVLPGPAAEQMKRLVNYREIEKPRYENGKKVGTMTKYYADPFALHLLRNLPTARFQGTAGQLTDPDQTGLMKALRFFTGVRGWSIDVEEQRYYREQAEMDELKRMLVQMGYVGVKDIVYEK